MAHGTYTSVDKMSKKAQKSYHDKQRNTWGGLSPVTRVCPNKGKNAYNRQAAKRECRAWA